VTPRITELAAATADLHWKGYPKLLQATGDRRMRPAAYDYDVVQADRDRWAVPEGRYTKYGDVTPLLDEPDDMFVVMRHGDELALEFGADGLPELESGWSRSIVLYLDGYLKYVDPYVAYGSSVAPMPFHGMSSYPYPPGEAYPSDEQHRRYMSEYNTREAGQSPELD
jgi:hypothetical protein